MKTTNTPQIYDEAKKRKKEKKKDKYLREKWLDKQKKPISKETK